MSDLGVTVIIPVRNAVNYISSALDSVLNQTSPPSEVIVVEDGSTDGTLELVEGNYGTRVKILSGPQTGAGPARNLGVNHSKTPLIAFLDADDIWHPEKLSKQLAVFEKGTVLGTYADYFVDSKSGRRYFGTSIRTKSDSESIKMMQSGSALPCLLSTWLFEREVFDQFGGFNGEFVYAQDFELALRLASGGAKFKVVREVLADYRIHQSSGSFTNYVSQRSFADYSRYKHVDGGSMDLKNWRDSFWTTRAKRHARAGYLFRLALGNMGKPLPIKALALLSLSIVLDPKGFAKKFKAQAKLKGLFQ